ncbi:MAG: prephenate dehydrogenase [Carboxydocellales bacterium]
MSQIFKRICIIGVGLIGGSLGMAVIQRGLAGEVVGVVRNQENLELALATAAIHRGTPDPIAGVEGADLVVLATPVGAYAPILKLIKPYLSPDAVITDVGSTKEKVVREAEEILGDQSAFIGGHPMAGSEQAGVKGADPYLFENAVYLLTPTVLTSQSALHKIANLCSALGAKVMTFTPEEHDQMVAAVSHLPHLIAATLVNTVSKLQQEFPQTLQLAAGGFKDTTRVAMGNPTMWRDILLSNQAHVLGLITKFQQTLTLLEEDIREAASADLVGKLESAQELRQKLPKKLKGYWPELYEIVVTVPDKPGMIAQIAAILAEEQINIADIEILRVREGEGGTIRLGFTLPGNDEAAIRILRSKGIIAKPRH